VSPQSAPLGPSQAPIRILIVDDHDVVREGLVAALGNDRRYEVVGTISNATEAIRCAKRTLPDVAVVDLRLPDAIGSDLCRKLVALLPSIRVVIFTTYLSEETVREALAAGAAAYLTKTGGLAELRRVLDELGPGDRAGGSAGPSQIVQKLHEVAISQAGGGGPTPQQQRVLELAAEGLTNDEIGVRLLISESTVRFHLQKMKAKLGARSKTELIARAIRSGLIAPAEEDLTAVRSAEAVRQFGPAPVPHIRGTGPRRA
jgi:DNA-binding NarL/FixJ family response regulator